MQSSGLYVGGGGVENNKDVDGCVVEGDQIRLTIH